MFLSARRTLVPCLALLILLLVAGSAGARPLSLPGVSASSDAPIGAALDTAAPVAGGGYAIVIGGNCLFNQAQCRSARQFPYGSHPVQLVVLNRSTLATVTSQQLGPGARSANLAAALATKYAGGNYLMVLADLPGTSTSPAYSTAIAIVTGSPRAGRVNWSGGWAAAGVPNATPTPGQVWGTLNPGFVAEGGHPLGDLRGYFQRAQLLPTVTEYSFVSGRYLSYDTSTAASGAGVDVMQIGSAQYTLTLPDTAHCAGGYAIVVLNAVNLATLSQGAYATNCQSGGEDSAGWRAVNAQLANAASIKSSLVFMQSIGNPANPGCLCSAFGYSSGPALETLGASAETFNRSLAAGGYLNENGNSSYAMVGSPAIAGDALPGSHPESYAPEAVSTLTGHPAQLQGMLRGDYQSNYIPVTGSDTPKTLGLTPATTEFMHPTQWPTGQTPGKPGELKVLQWISNGAQGGPHPFVALHYSAGSSCYQPIVKDVRFEFCDVNRDYTDVEHAMTTTVPAACGCSQPDWTAVTTDLSLEISARNNILHDFSTLNSVYGNGVTCSNATVDLKSITARIVGLVKVSGNSLIAGGLWDLLASDALNVITSILYDFPDNDKAAKAANILNNVSALGYLAADLVNAVDHYRGVPPSLAGRVSATANTLGPILKQTYCTTQFGLGRAEAAIMSDYGRLIAQGNSPSLQVSQSTLNAIEPDLELSADRFIYEHLLPVIYHPYALLVDGKENPAGTTLAKYRCGNNGSDTHGHPWATMAPGASIRISAYDPPNPLGNSQAVAIVLSSPTNFRRAFTSINPRKPPATLMQTLTGSLANGDLGISPFDLLLHHFRRYAIACGTYKVFKGFQNTTYGPSDVSWP
ncbi:MAG: hypothetical protein ACXVSL_06695 [Solirubrobacteraceae bacterium]